MTRSMYTQSGELVIISGVKIKLRPKFLKSMQLRIVVLTGVVRDSFSVLLKGLVLKNSEQRSCRRAQQTFRINVRFYVISL